MRILICDDDWNINQLLQKYIIEFFKYMKLKCPEIILYTSGEELLFDSGAKDIVFLDVEIPGINGICVGRKLKENDPNTIIFIITSYVEYLDEAMRFHVFRYLSKPLDKQRLFQNIKDAIRVYYSTNIKIPIETKEGVFTSPVSDIILIESLDRTITIYTPNNKFTVIHNMEHWAAKFDMPCFFRTHHSFIINMKYVTHFDRSLIYLYNDIHTAYLTKRNYSKFKEAYLLYLESTR